MITVKFYISTPLEFMEQGNSCYVHCWKSEGDAWFGTVLGPENGLHSEFLSCWGFFSG